MNIPGLKTWIMGGDASGRAEDIFFSSNYFTLPLI